MVRLALGAVLTPAAGLVLVGALLGSGAGPATGPGPATGARAAPGLPAGRTAAPVSAAAPARDTLVIIANPAVADDDVSLADVRRAFLLRRRFWDDGVPVAPVNLPASSPLRDAFSRAVLGASTTALSAYWNDLYFHGVSPPPVLESEQAVLLYVARTRGAIGYVRLRTLINAESAESAEGARVVAGVRVLLVVQARDERP